jgi:hypothetical protein
MPNKNLAPIVLFVYNRPLLTKTALEHLMANELAADSTLYIYADGPKENASLEQINNIEETRKIIKQKQWCGKVHIVENNKNKGLAQSVITGVTRIVEEYGTVIVLEDDLLISPTFLRFMNDALERYKDEEKVFQISGFNFPIKQFQNPDSFFFMPLISSWGWATWHRAWQQFDAQAKGYEALKTDKLLRHQFDLNSAYPYSEMLISQMEHKNIDSWAIRWFWTLFRNNKLTLFPETTFVSNIGYGENATHTKFASKQHSAQHINAKFSSKNFPEIIEIDLKKWKRVRNYLASCDKTKLRFSLQKKLASIFYKVSPNLDSKTQ